MHNNTKNSPNVKKKRKKKCFPPFFSYINDIFFISIYIFFCFFRKRALLMLLLFFLDVSLTCIYYCSSLLFFTHIYTFFPFHFQTNIFSYFLFNNTHEKNLPSTTATTKMRFSTDGKTCLSLQSLKCCFCPPHR